jgi:hypothetical protein
MTKYPPKHLVELNGTESDKELADMAIYDLATENQDLCKALRQVKSSLKNADLDENQGDWQERASLCISIINKALEEDE